MKTFSLFLGCFLFSIMLFAQGELAEKYLHKDEHLEHALVGVMLYDVDRDSVVYSHNGERFFTVASNNKLYTLYAATLFLGDSTTGVQYQKRKDTLYVRGTGDPTFLHADFEKNAVYDLLSKSKSPIALVEGENYNDVFAPGWTWEDYNGSYQPERSNFPIYGNVVRFSLDKKLRIEPNFFSAPERLAFDTINPAEGFYVRRDQYENEFYYRSLAPSKNKEQLVPFVTSMELTRKLLQDSLHQKVYISKRELPGESWRQIGNVPLDSMLKPMMQRSDNFYAEQTQTMIAQKLFDKTDTREALNHLIKYKLEFLPHKPRLADGSGLSNYSLSTPADLVTVLKALKASVPEERLFNILPTGGEGTLSNLYEEMEGEIYGKTGTLSGAVAFSGYLTTASNRKVIFSVVINGLTEHLNTGRKATENFLKAVYEQY